MQDNIKTKVPSGSQSLYKGLKIIDTLSQYPNGCPLANLSELTCLNKSTVYRLLQGLQSCGYVQPATNSGSYKLTTKMLILGYRVFSSSNIYTIVQPHLEKLNLAFGETVNFSKRYDDHAILLYKLEPRLLYLRTRAIIGQYMYLYCSGMGKCFLAFEHDDDIRNYWESHSSEIRPFTANTIVNYHDLCAELQKIRREYISIDNEENELGISCVAAPIFDIYHSCEYAISVSSTTKKLEALGYDKLREAVRQTAVNISRELGCENYFEAGREAPEKPAP